MPVSSAIASPPTDQALVEECLRGDQGAWRQLIERYKNLIYSYPRRYGAGPADSADVFQAVCAELFLALPRLRDARCVRGWICTVAAHESLRWKRGHIKRSEREGDEFHLATAPSVAVSAPEELLAAERAQAVREAIASLAPRCQRMLQMLFYSDPPVPYQTVAARLGLATGSVGLIRARCLKKLERALEAIDTAGTAPGRRVNGSRSKAPAPVRSRPARALRAPGAQAALDAGHGSGFSL